MIKIETSFLHSALLNLDYSISRGQGCEAGGTFQCVVAFLGADSPSISSNGDLASCGKLGNLLTVHSVFVTDVCEKSFHSFALSVTSKPFIFLTHSLLYNLLD